MPKNYSKDSLENRLPNTIRDLQKKSKEARTNQNTWQGYLPLPVLAIDPPVTATGQFGLYYNSGSGKVRKSYNGGAWADTTI